METTPAGQVRLDKWLWAARFYKSRSLAHEAVSGGHVRVNGRSTKPSRAVTVGDVVSIQKGALTWTVIVRETSHRRRGVPMAAGLYDETPDSITARQAAIAQRRAQRAGRDDTGMRSGGRPSKRDRRRLQRWRNAGDDLS